MIIRKINAKFKQYYDVLTKDEYCSVNGIGNEDYDTENDKVETITGHSVINELFLKSEYQGKFKQEHLKVLDNGKVGYLGEYSWIGITLTNK